MSCLDKQGILVKAIAARLSLADCGQIQLRHLPGLEERTPPPQSLSR